MALWALDQDVLPIDHAQLTSVANCSDFASATGMRPTSEPYPPDSNRVGVSEEDKTAGCGAHIDTCKHGESECQGDILRMCLFNGWVQYACSGFLNGRCVDTEEGARCEESTESGPSE
jgi:hypothetical protein